MIIKFDEFMFKKLEFSFELFLVEDLKSAFLSEKITRVASH